MMNKGTILAVFLLLILMSTPSPLLNAPKVRGDAVTIIYIRANGSIDPPTANITSLDNVTYIFTDNNYYPIIIERNSIILDGASFTLQALSGTGIDISGRSNVTIRNMKIERCGQQASVANGIYLDSSYNNTIFNVSITNTKGAVAISLSYSSGNRIHGNFLKNNGVHLYQTIDNVIYNNTFVNSIIELKGNRDRVYHNNFTEGEINLYGKYNSVYENFVTKNGMEGIYVGGEFNNVTRNTITECQSGILLRGHHGHILRENKMTNNTFNFGLLNEGELELYNDVDVSNTVDGKPIYFWNGVRDSSVPLDAGVVVLRECVNITIRDLNLRKNLQGIVLIYSRNCTVLNNTIIENSYEWIHPSSGGITLLRSSGNHIEGNNITNNNVAGIGLTESWNNTISENFIAKNEIIGIDVLDSNYTVISGNSLVNNRRGIRLSFGFYNNASKNRIVGPGFYGIEAGGLHTTIINNDVVYCMNGIELGGNFKKIIRNNIMENWEAGIHISSGKNNTIYHNNFVDNNKHVSFNYPRPGDHNTWDNGYPSGGNYWSGYEDKYPNATELDNSGIWNTPHNVCAYNVDNYPLIVPTRPITRKFTAYSSFKVEIYSNSSISDFQFNTTEKKISFNITGPKGTAGFCNLSIPNGLLWGVLSLYIDGSLLVENVDYTKVDNGTHFIFYVTYLHSSHALEISATEAIPEFLHLLLTLLIITVSSITIALAKKKSFRK